MRALSARQPNGFLPVGRFGVGQGFHRRPERAADPQQTTSLSVAPGDLFCVPIHAIVELRTKNVRWLLSPRPKVSGRGAAGT